MKFLNKAILLEKTLILSDLHIGMESSLRKKGTLVPNTQFPKLFKEVQALMRMKPKKVILNGDIKHDFGTISPQEWREILKLLDFLTKRAEVFLIKGNHDPVTPIIAKKRNLPVYTHMLIGNTYICHGDKIPNNKDFEKATTVIVGHAHPAITLREGAKTEKYKCFVKAKWKKKTLIILPSFTNLVEGSDIQREKPSSFLKEIKKADITVAHDGELFSFGKVSLNH
jgi:putative SbcD/Mre11-related phosphoesterase